MAAPTITAPGTPAGSPLLSGHGALIVFSSSLTLAIWEKSVTPFGFQGGEMIDTGNMRNGTVTTKAPQDLVDISDATIRVAYDPDLLASYLGMINVPDQITVCWPPRSGTRAAMAVWGVMRSFVPEEMVKSQEAQQPTAMITVSATNMDPDTGTEDPPVTGTI